MRKKEVRESTRTNSQNEEFSGVNPHDSRANPLPLLFVSIRVHSWLEGANEQRSKNPRGAGHPDDCDA